MFDRTVELVKENREFRRELQESNRNVRQLSMLVTSLIDRLGAETDNRVSDH